MSVSQPILTVQTSKNWVLPPRPKNARKAKSPDKKKKPTPPPTDDLNRNINIVEKENYQLKVRLLSLIHDYKSLRALVTSASSPPVLYDTATTARKRLFNELDSMSELISNMNGLSHEHAKEQEVFNFVNLHDEEFGEIADEEIDFDDSSLLSRLISPGLLETDDNLLMTSLTRSTTVSTNNSSLDKKQMFKFFDLPAYSEDDYTFLFEQIDPPDKMMSVIEEDHYNQVADFLEEKLMSNDVQYYVEKLEG